MKLFKLAALSGAVFSFLALAGCDTTSLNAKIQSSLPKICSDASVLYAAFQAAEPAINGSAPAKVDAAYNALQAICTNPSSATAATVLVDAAGAYASFALALKNAK